VFDRPAGSSGGARVSASAEVPEDIVERIRTPCLALPEVTVRVEDWVNQLRHPEECSSQLRHRDSVPGSLTGSSQSA